MLAYPCLISFQEHGVFNVLCPFLNWLILPLLPASMPFIWFSWHLIVVKYFSLWDMSVSQISCMFSFYRMLVCLPPAPHYSNHVSVTNSKAPVFFYSDIVMGHHSHHVGACSQHFYFVDSTYSNSLTVTRTVSWTINALKIINTEKQTWSCTWFSVLMLQMHMTRCVKIDQDVLF